MKHTKKEGCTRDNRGRAQRDRFRIGGWAGVERLPGRKVGTWWGGLSRKLNKDRESILGPGCKRV